MIGYARTSDYVHGAAAAAAGPGLLLAMEKFAPSYVGKGGFSQAMRLGGFLGVAGGFLYFYQRSIRTSPLPLQTRALGSQSPGQGWRAAHIESCSY